MAIQDLLKQFVEAAVSPTPAVLAIGVAFAVLFPFILHLIFSSSTAYVVLPSILVAGPSGSGKTALITHLERRGNHVSTHLTQLPHSVELSIASAKGDSKPKSYREDLDAQGAEASKFLVQDTPGHGKLRASALKHVANVDQDRVRGVVFVVDAAALAEPAALADAAGFLYDVLIILQKRVTKRAKTGARGTPRGVPVLIAANKMDLFTAMPAAQVKTSLETELGRIRSTRSRGLLDSGVGADDVADGADESDGWLGEVGSEKFSFGQLDEFDIDVNVLGGNVEGKGAGVDTWWEWIGEQL